ncbi:hypothetical protein TTHERM_00621510 (macronuclear) [Tetrahymena thermophila SB210]|uniref:Uncharacterized protein n=1 Tax=Tetrahymena thermophila (strain SB210) TaxID=312017 RepID=Q23MA8_TETTS|nr:hypothetical protein TTHERM_00621510 [Tetrahymena thermophila SB210]EAR97731.1 hypothetical protein TTHERM_00621510 [Tetrahymena thermophila SB210]|eukprot:XP_001017976.1 hypothetical protein TTHERM_00621510 [Tetrahymena thermophila SB210]
MVKQSKHEDTQIIKQQRILVLFQSDINNCKEIHRRIQATTPYTQRSGQYVVSKLKKGISLLIKDLINEVLDSTI